MKRLVCMALSSAIALGGCSHAQVAVNSGTPPPAPAPTSTLITSGPSGLHVQSTSSAFTAAIIAASLLAGAVAWSSEERAFPDPSSLISSSPAPPPPLSPTRRVREQDCSRPIADPYSNLKCR